MLLMEEEGHAGGVGQLGMAHHQMGQPPRLGCLGMCTGQCAVVDVNSKCWRNMLEPGWALEARRKASEARRRESEGACGRRKAPEVVGECWRGAMLPDIGPSIGP